MKLKKLLCRKNGQEFSSNKSRVKLVILIVRINQEIIKKLLSLVKRVLLEKSLLRSHLTSQHKITIEATQNNNY